MLVSVRGYLSNLVSLPIRPSIPCPPRSSVSSVSPNTEHDEIDEDYDVSGDLRVRREIRVKNHCFRETIHVVRKLTVKTMKHILISLRAAATLFTSSVMCTNRYASLQRFTFTSTLQSFFTFPCFSTRFFCFVGFSLLDSFHRAHTLTTQQANEKVRFGENSEFPRWGVFSARSCVNLIRRLHNISSDRRVEKEKRGEITDAQ